MEQSSTSTDAVRNKAIAGTPKKNLCLTLVPPKVEEQQKTVVVLGVERGGTSMVAGVIRALGVDMGQRVGLNHEDPRFMAEEPEKLKKAINIRNKEADIWGFKMPKAVNLLDFYEKNLRNPCYLIVHRNLAAVADSWHQRGAGSYLDVMDRALTYHSLIVGHLRNSSRPVIVVNYERAVANKREFVIEMANFLGIQPTESLIEKASSMVTGDGKGYVNLPEHFFVVTPHAQPQERPELLTADNLSEVVSADGWIEFDKLKKKLVLKMEDGGALPTNFWLHLDFDAPDDVDLAGMPLRVYFDYIGEMFPAHCARPAVQRGSNWYLVETSGKANAIGFGPLVAGIRFRLHATLYQAKPGDVDG